MPVTIYKTDNEEQRYFYDVSGNRIRKQVFGSTDNYYVQDYDGKTAVVLNAPSGSNYTYNIWGLDNIGQVKVVNSTPTRYYYLKDHLGSIKMTVNTSGNPVSWDDYYPFGAIMPGRSQNNASIDGRFKFTEKERDAESGYDYFGARYYDSFIARWLQVDPLDLFYPNLSPFTYCKDNPIRYMDPNGMWDEESVKNNKGNWWFNEEMGVMEYRDVVVTDNENTMGFSLWGLGTAGSAIELSKSTYRLSKGGYISPKIYFPTGTKTYGWGGGSRASIKTFKFASSGKLVSRFALVSATAIDIWGLRNYYLYGPDSPNAVSPEKFGLNVGMGIFALKLNPVAGVLYFGVDATIGWEEAIWLQTQFYLEQRSIWEDHYNSALFEKW